MTNRELVASFVDEYFKHKNIHVVIVDSDEGRRSYECGQRIR